MNFIKIWKVTTYALALLLILFISESLSPIEVRAQDYVKLESLSTISHPSALAVDSEENLYVLHSGFNRLNIYNSNGDYLRSLDGLDHPLSLATGPQDNIYIGSLDDGSVTVYSPTLQPLYQLGNGTGEFERPLAIAVASDGTVYVADAGIDQIKVYTNQGDPDFSFGSSGSSNGEFNYPTALAVSEEEGLLVVADLRFIDPETTSGGYSYYDSGLYHGARLQVFDLSGNYLNSFGDYELEAGGLIKPLGLSFGPAGRIMVVDAYQGVVQLFDVSGNYQGAIYDSSSPLKIPLDLAAGPVTNRIFIASYSENRVEIYGTPPEEGGTAVIGAISTTEGTTALAGEILNAAAITSPDTSFQPLDLKIYGKGSVVSSPGGISCPGDCRAQYRSNSRVTLTAVPEAGQRFVSWEGDCSGGTYSCTVTMDDQKSVRAFFLSDNGGINSLKDLDFSMTVAEAAKQSLENGNPVPADIYVEDFESGDFSKLPWLTGRRGGEGGWTVQDIFCYEGKYAAQAPEGLAPGGMGFLETTLAMVETDSISFRFKFESPDASKLTFKIDDRIAGLWSKEDDWTPASFEVEEGLHTFRWEYNVLDSGRPNGLWLDAIDLPAHAENVYPVPDIKINAEDGSLNLSPGDPLVVTVGIAAGQSLGEEADWWLALETPNGLLSYDEGTDLWIPGLFPAYGGALIDIVEHQKIVDIEEPPAGNCTFYFGVDLNMDNVLNESFIYDSVKVQMTE